jgi:crotonobetainyl-CoA:carnitine CoA-transferase CaiB-like acyl-CoA transferase
MDSSDRDLAGVRVLSMGTYVAGNVAAMLLGALGADVVKVEARDRPEALRTFDAPGAPRPVEPSGARTTAVYAGLTRDMRSICLDMGSEPGRETFRRLAGKSDVVIENLGAGKMAAWGCAFADLVAHNPTLVMLSISGYGATGPLAPYRAYASSIASFIGLTAAWALDGIHCDFVTAAHAASAVLAGLAAVRYGAPGTYIDMAQTEATAAMMAPLYLDFLANGRQETFVPNRPAGAVFAAVVRCTGTDAWLAVELEDGHDWTVLCDYLGRADLSVHTEEVSAESHDDLLDALEDWASHLTPLQATVALQHVGLAAGPVQNNEDLWRDVQLRSRGALVEVDHPDIAIIEYSRAFPSVGNAATGAQRRSPRLGEHTAEVLANWLQLDRGDIEALEQGGAIWQPSEP